MEPSGDNITRNEGAKTEIQVCDASQEVGPSEQEGRNPPEGRTEDTGMESVCQRVEKEEKVQRVDTSTGSKEATEEVHNHSKQANTKQKKCPLSNGNQKKSLQTKGNQNKSLQTKRKKKKSLQTKGNQNKSLQTKRK
ncbi:unnamed protein product [Menidia menidia]|uniref:(Atlantic silverside) hypothetical protein n=1 Tax=Menidia menidia TaxID=238744 RepID=A0A8S4ALW3_9TELE|nr:unnamed protein product [Menidia menidia]